ncbi:GntR family transcriptional regulator [Anaerotignum lactatifermentans]|uniref:GntR family transcriptional regulator n=2 Tax=Anaerotignum lactatifermentans TaxID=160404 RepID=A0ABS2GD28_9FIRM|nr:GntR family transcriptional regulator [Anaerotignum lactatifermentans]MBM6878453.1 GntR family transcriptional regulator [Anaerotignum lactatifermentans]MBM6951625.1 GntR family transcriptional regulator [Anaerotignum lactatifermentans]
MTLRALSGAMEPGEKIPPVRELAAQFGVNPNTMQRAMVEMERDGLVYTERTSGRFLTKEEQVLAEKRKAFAREETKKYLDYMKKIGFTTEEVAAYVKALGEKGEETT